jgi:hypothetical protein
MSVHHTMVFPHPCSAVCIIMQQHGLKHMSRSATQEVGAPAASSCSGAATHGLVWSVGLLPANTHSHTPVTALPPRLCFITNTCITLLCSHGARIPQRSVGQTLLCQQNERHSATAAQQQRSVIHPCTTRKQSQSIHQAECHTAQRAQHAAACCTSQPHCHPAAVSAGAHQPWHAQGAGPPHQRRAP